MPFDGRGFGNPAKFVKPEVFSLEGLVAWLEQQPVAGRYNFFSADRCLVAKFVRAHGGRRVHRASNTCTYADASGRVVINDYFSPLLGVASQFPHTYGEALSRARQLLATA